MMWHQVLMLAFLGLLLSVSGDQYHPKYPQSYDFCGTFRIGARSCSLDAIEQGRTLVCDGQIWIPSDPCVYANCCKNVDGEAACGVPVPEDPSSLCDFVPAVCPKGTKKDSTDYCRIPALYASSPTLRGANGKVASRKREEVSDCDETKGFCLLLSDDDEANGNWDVATENPDFDLPFDTRCDPDDNSQVQRFDGTNWVHHFTCDIKDSCLDVNGQGGCRTGNKVLIPSKLEVSSDSDELLDSENDSQASHRMKRLDPHKVSFSPPQRPNALHSIDTRCNPANLTEVQRFNGSVWQLHYVCPFEDSCKDVNGIGACLLKRNHYLLPAANDTTDMTRPLDDPPIVGQTKCNATGGTEVLAWNGTAWAFDKVCLSPYTCIDFHGADGLAVCALPGSLSEQVWTPWPAPSNDSDSKSVTTMCKSKRELLHWNGTVWAHERACSDGWSCRVDDQPPHNAGCFSAGIAKVLRYRKHRQHLAARDDQLFENAWNNVDVYFSDRDESDDELVPVMKKRLPPTFPKRPSNPNGLKARRVSSSASAEPSLSDDVEIVYVDPPEASPTPTPAPPVKQQAAIVSEDERERCDGSWVGVHRCNPVTNEFQVCSGSRKKGGHWKKDGDCHKSGGFCVQKGKGAYQQAWCQLMDFDDASE
jgi:hypothetical protein